MAEENMQQSLLEAQDDAYKPAYPSGVARLSEGSIDEHNACFEPVTKTLSSDDPEMAAKRAAWFARKEQKAQQRSKSGGLGSKDLLSGLPEVESDVQYRFNFIVMGHAAAHVAEATCSSNNAVSLPSAVLDRDNERESLMAPASPSNPSASPSRRSQSAKFYRCLGSIGSPLAPEVRDNKNLAKLVFNPMEYGQEVPVCKGRLEALRTVNVCILNVDSDAANFTEQLQNLSATVQDIRSRSRPKHRPVRALILTYPPGSSAANEGDGQNQWASSLADYEQHYGELWKFGPLSADDADGLHDIFSEMASVRIIHYQNMEANGIVDEDDGKGQEDEEQIAQDFLLPVNGDAVRQEGRQVSSGSSECSEGCERPPVFEAECSGSECSDGAVELHTRMFGFTPEESAVATS